MLWRLWGPLTWLYYRGWPANTGPKGSKGENIIIISFEVESLSMMCLNPKFEVIDRTNSFLYRCHIGMKKLISIMEASKKASI